MKTRLTRHPATGRIAGCALAFVSVLTAAPAARAAMTIASDALVAHPGLTRVGGTVGAKTMTVAIVLPSRDAAGAAAFVAHVGKPGDPLFRHYLSPAVYAARYGASAADYDAVVAWARAAGLTPGERYAARTVLPVSGTASALEAALGVRFGDFRNAQNRTVYAADRAPTLPDDVGRRVASIIGLSSANHFAPLLRRLPAGAHPQLSGHGPGGAYDAADLRAIYSVPPQPFPKTQILAVFEQGGFDPNDVAVYAKANKLPAIKVSARGVNGYGGGIDDPGIELEAVLDIDMECGINPAAGGIVVYEDGTDSFPVALLDAFSAMATDDLAQTIGVSYGLDEALQGGAAIAAENSVLTQLAAQGQALFVSSGDDGAFGDEPPNLNVSDPASQPLVTAVGGTTVFSGPKEAYYAEETWNDLGAGDGATGGGVSSIWAIPDYQIQFGNAVATYNGGSATYRNVPDVASDANPLSGVAVYSAINGGWILLGGTSVSAPIWAGFYSLAISASEGLGFGMPGFANPSIYTLGSNFGHLYPDFHDVYDGTNGNLNYGAAGFSAGYGYDNTTGFGSFDGSNLMIDLALVPTNANSNPPPAPNGLVASATPTSITLQWSGAAGDAGYLFLGNNTNDFAPVATTMTHKRHETASGLAPGALYVFQVVSITAGGTTPSAPIYVTTPKAAK